MAALTISIHLLASMLCIEAGSGSISVNYGRIANNLPSQPTRIPPSNLLHQFVEAAAKPQGSRQTAGLISPWNPEEDELLQQLVQKHGPRNWSLISKSIPGRSGKSCRLRWCKQLSPQVEHRAFTPDEDDTIIRAHAKFGNKWATIARLRHLQGRRRRALLRLRRRRTLCPTVANPAADRQLLDYTAEIPDECLALIFQSLSSGDRKCCSLVSRRWFTVKGQSRHRLALNAAALVSPNLPSIFTRFDSVTKLALHRHSGHLDLVCPPPPPPGRQVQMFGPPRPGMPPPNQNQQQ